MRIHAGLWGSAVALGLATGPGGALAIESLRIDPARTAIRFEVPSAVWGATRGQFGRFSGRLSIDFDRPANSRVSFDVDAGSVTTGSAALDSYIKSEVLFDVARFPTMSFVSRSVEKVDERTARVLGDLTLHGETRAFGFLVDVERKRGGRSIIAFLARGQVQRSQFGLDAGIPVVSDEVTIIVSTETAEP